MRLTVAALLAAVMLVSACNTPDEEATTITGVGVAPTPGAAGGPQLAGVAVTPGSLQDFQTNVGDRVFFAFDRSDLTPEAQATLDRQAQWLQQYQNVGIVVEGHADERGTREYNLALGDRRANAVRSYLVARGIPAARISTVSFGKERPAVAGSSEAAWAQNRRGVTVLQ
jgi:peptidoglycan-associated lipoprotein